MSFWSFFKKKEISEKFRIVICDPVAEAYSIHISKYELINGFKNLDTIKCLENISPNSFWFTLLRDGKQMYQPVVIKFENRKDIPILLKKFQLEKDDIVQLTILCSKPFVNRREKQLQIE